MRIVEIKDLVFKYPSSGGRFVLNVPAFSVEAGESVALLGESGSGKSTLLKIMALLESGFSGSLELFGCFSPDVSAAPALASLARRPGAGDAVQHTPGGNSRLDIIRKMAFLFQDAPMFYGDVFENVAIGLRIRGEKKDDIVRKVKNALEILNISDLERCDSREISGGQARRVCMARAIALEPEILFLDEPFYSVDNPTKHEIMRDFKKYLSNSRCAMVLVTHDRNEALSLCGRIAVMKRGSI
ncbi:MAG TPA: ATP-binding cassette domain-containing protein, partial [Candidatus Wallbacteria bacterium]|nr:ATP-binding cassette domain-containing protein [Candidatus Wallbacteria bacterium]